MNEHFVASVKVILAMIIVGSSVVAGKLLAQSFPVFLASELRFLVATIIMIPILIRIEGFSSIQKREMLILFLQGLFGVFLYSIFMLYGLTFTTAIDAGIITSTIPAVTGGLAFLFLKEKLTKSVSVGILLAVLGTLIINVVGSASDIERGSSPIFGNLLIFGAVICEALFIILGKFVSQRVSPLAISTIVSVLGTILFLPLSLYEGAKFNFEGVTMAEWGLILYFGIVVTVIAFILMYQGVSKVPASTVGVLTGVLPISSVILSVLILGEKISFFHFIGISFTLTAILLSNKQPAKKLNRTNC
ncbi:DMT family transporter [Virgibacillus sp. 6R]|uniref:DMT family transporter n=1 Tax=Metabacillus sp. 22489 TaxID=3453928 RepID=UPI0011A01115